VTGCGGISKDLKVTALKVPEQLRGTEELIGKLKNEYERFKQTDQFKSEFIRYGGPDRENWDSNFNQASSALAEAGRIYENEVKKILERNKSEEQPNLKKQLKIISDKMALCRQSAQKTGLRISRLQQAKDSMGEMFSDGEDKNRRIDGLFKELDVFVKDSQKTYLNKKEDLDTRFSWFEKTHQEILTAFQIVKKEQASGTPDLALFADNHDLIAKQFEAFTLRNQDLRKKIGELGRSYSKILRDMKLEQKPWLEEVRYEWDNWSDWDTTKEVYRRKRYISMKDYSSLVNKVGEAGGIISRGNDYEVWIEDIDVDESYYHMYLFVEDEKQTPGDWEKVEGTFYDANEENLNMSILTKPLGVYEEEVIKVAMPPGFDKVGDPRYGKWVENKDTGERQWSFFQKYLFWSMILNGNRFGRNYYSYDRYNDWNSNYRGRKPYYGRSGGDFGSGGRSTMTNPGMKGSTYAKSGGFKTTTPSVRGAGTSNRSRGPGAGK
jgi:hypothetical protein|nr:hypothetical protein [Desulfobacteraceae bacterium]